MKAIKLLGSFLEFILDHTKVTGEFWVNRHSLHGATVGRLLFPSMPPLFVELETLDSAELLPPVSPSQGTRDGRHDQGPALLTRLRHGQR